MPAKKKAFVFASKTVDEVQRGEEVTLPCGLVARVVDSTQTPQLAEAHKRAALKVGGKKALTDMRRMAGAVSVESQNRVYAGYHLAYLRTPNGEPLKLTGLSANGATGASLEFADGKVSEFADKLAVLETFPQIREEVKEAIGDNALEDIAEVLAGN